MLPPFRLACFLFLAVSPWQAMAQGATDAPSVTCQPMGHDLILYNRGEAPLAEGTVVRWSVWNGKRQGELKLDAELVPFVGLQLSGALGASYFWDRPCAAAVVQASN